MAGWKGDRKIQDNPDDVSNKILVVAANRNRTLSFHQFLSDLEGSKFQISFDVKPSDDYKGEGIKLRVDTAGATARSWKDIPIDWKGWRKEIWTFSNWKDAKKLRFQVDVNKGEGSLFFDNFELKAVE